jgi:hypothetical protein
VTDHLLAEQKRAHLKHDPTVRAAEKRAAETGIHDRVAVDIKRLLAGKSYTQLQLLETEIRRRLDNSDTLDIAYWQTLLQYGAVVFCLHPDAYTQR